MEGNGEVYVGGLTGDTKGKFCRMVIKKTLEESALARTRWARENQRASPIWASDHRRRRDGIVLLAPHRFSYPNQPNRSEPEAILHNYILAVLGFPGPGRPEAHIHPTICPPLSSDYHSLPSTHSFSLLFSRILSYFSPQFWLCISLVAQTLCS